MDSPRPDSSYETKRLAALNRYQILDTEAERAFDDLAELAARICRVKISVVSFIDSTRQWYKSKVGLTATEIPIESTFCQYVIQSPDKVLAVSDATTDVRFQNNALVIGEPGIRYYLGAPIVTTDGYPIGTVCAIDFQARQIDPEDIKALTVLSRQVVTQLELRMHVLNLEEHAAKEQKIQKALREATQAKSFFLANMSHEIRTPLTSIIGFADVLKDKNQLTEQNQMPPFNLFPATARTYYS